MEEGLTTRLNSVEEKLRQFEEAGIKPKKPKEFKIPRAGKVGNLKAKNNWITIMKLNENGSVRFEKDQIQQQTVIVDGVPRIATGKHIFHYKRNPLMILPSCSVEPLKMEDIQPLTSEGLTEMSLNNNTNVKGFKLLLERAKLGEIKKKKSFGSIGLIIGGLVALGIIGYIIFG